MRAFLMSEKPFKENTANPLLGEFPMPTRYKTIQGAIGACNKINSLFEIFEKESVVDHPESFFRRPEF